MFLTTERFKSILVNAGVIDDKTFDEAYREAEKAGQPLEEILIGRGEVPEYYLSELLGKSLNIPTINLQGVSIDRSVLERIPESYAQSKQLVLFDFNEEVGAKVAMLDPLDYGTIEFLRVKLGAPVEAYITAKSSLNGALKQYKEKIGTEFSKVIAENVGRSLSITGETDLSKMAESVPIISILKNIMEYAIVLGASDIHFEPFFKNLIIRYRVDGVLREIFNLPKQIEPILIARIKILANLQIDEHRIPQDGRFKFEMSEKEYIDVRVNVAPVLYGEKGEMRLLRSTARPLTLEELGLSSDKIKIVQEGIKKPHGMILVTGPTGSGKTTTLYAILNILNTPKVNITTIEDPIEYEVAGINQIQVNQKAGITFANGLRSILRQDPNIIMIGEIRDEETVNIGIHAALTGHLLLSSLHTNDAPSAIPRLLDMKAPPFILASTINMVVAQRLVRKICLACIESYEASTEINKLVEAQLVLIGHETGENIKNKLPKTLYRGKGCNVCGDSGYKGQIALFEVLKVSDGVKELALKSAPSDEIRELAIKEGMDTLFQDGLEKAKAGVTTIEEVLRVIQE
ncbi:MAG TPA: GspE/PulE family protein [Candidatus Paceibacterota bacterium]